MRTFTEKYLGGSTIPEDRYKIDLIVLEKYQSFSTELLRLALLGIAVYGFLVTNVVLKLNESNLEILTGGYLSPTVLLLGALSFCVAALTSLAHRFYSSDCLTHFVRILRLRDAEEVQEIESEQVSLDKDLARCKYLLLVSCCSLVSGALLVALSFSLVILRT